MAAYSSAVNHSYQAYGISLEHAVIVVAIPGMSAEVFWFDLEAMQSYWQQWEQRVAIFGKQQGRRL
jgi:genome maintenance exonuclease 1